MLDEADPAAVPDADGTPAGAGKRAPRATPVRVPELLHFDLEGLRSYRRELADEETRVSYWRRILQARLDMLRSSKEDPSAVDRLQRVLGGEKAQTRSQALLGHLNLGDAPPLPNLRELWEAETGDPDEIITLIGRLSVAEQELSTYRSALHTRLDLSTRELIARYREDPQSCLVALPIDR